MPALPRHSAEIRSGVEGRFVGIQAVHWGVPLRPSDAVAHPWATPPNWSGVTSAATEAFFEVYVPVAWASDAGYEDDVRAGVVYLSDVLTSASVAPRGIPVYTTASRFVGGTMNRVFPMPASVPYGELVGVADSRGDGLAARLLSELEQEPVEAGFDHPADELIRWGMARAPTIAAQALFDLYGSLALTRPSLAADLVTRLVVLGTSQHAPSLWRLLDEAIENPDVRMRDAAARVLEQWGGLAAVGLLQQRADREPIRWLADFMRGVVDDLAAQEQRP